MSERSAAKVHGPPCIDEPVAVACPGVDSNDSNLSPIRSSQNLTLYRSGPPLFGLVDPVATAGVGYFAASEKSRAEAIEVAGSELLDAVPTLVALGLMPEFGPWLARFGAWWRPLANSITTRWYSLRTEWYSLRADMSVASASGTRKARKQFLSETVPGTSEHLHAKEELQDAIVEWALLPRFSATLERILYVEPRWGKALPEMMDTFARTIADHGVGPNREQLRGQPRLSIAKHPRGLVLGFVDGGDYLTYEIRTGRIVEFIEALEREFPALVYKL